MHRCALVSVNGGWNLLIGAQTTSGTWAAVHVPPACATLWDEAGKDACFERAAWRAIAAAPGAWIARAPAKVAATLDVFGAAPWYLRTSNPGAFSEEAKLRLSAIELIACRLLLVGALAVAAGPSGPRVRARLAIAACGAVAACTPAAWLGYVALSLAIGLLGRRALAAAPVVVASTAAVIAATVLVHAVFFGAGRYGLVVTPFVAAMAFVPRAGAKA